MRKSLAFTSSFHDTRGCVLVVEVVVRLCMSPLLTTEHSTPVTCQLANTKSFENF